MVSHLTVGLQHGTIGDKNSLGDEIAPVRRLYVCLSSVTLVRPTQAVQIFGNISRH